MAFKVGLLGFGTVGTGTAAILRDRDRRNPLLQDIEIGRVGVKSLDKPRAIALDPDLLTTDLESIVTDPDIDIVVELIGGLEPARSLILKAIAAGKHVVTANKAVIARYGDELYAAANKAGVYILLEASVGGGIPIIKPLKESLGANRISQITGIVNGTTNYILTQMTEEGADFDAVLTEAQQLGYAEADPTADVDGLDAADKIAILASLAFGGRIDREAIYCEGIRQVSAEDISYAEKLGFTIKLLAIAQKTENRDNTLQVRVHPTLLPNAHPLASINGVYNAVLVEGEPIGQVMFFGPGAGEGPTASAVVSDILAIAGILKSAGKNTALNPLLSCSHQDYSAIAPMEEVVTRFYARFLCGDRPGVIGHLGTCFGKHEVSLESVVQIGFQDKLAEIVVVTHDVQEKNFRQALEEVRSFSALDSISIASVLRVF
ncbi:homoserine dehydrogenase [Lusitaniella coriacea LEGE 07157]|uniref:Homoserine dehydrogenase n=1 Tax=Lusitaniella coriacea LEGE 07157 TaxID=945747 RepID=A0A8J7J9Q3_9CYAN|nr:homoserine dehydrogenase [Lusitaniella coriacea]MBE9116350.1 homoserine dehydrogenase [Lusitaniella coriacea LEGE 07157]